MTTNDIDAEALLLDQNYFELDAQGYAAFQEMGDNPPPTTARLHRTLSAGRDAYRRQIVVTVSQELTARLGAGFSGQALIRMARFVGWMPSAIRRLQGGFATRSSQILVTVSRALTPHQGGGFSCAEVTHMADRREVGLVAGQA